MAFTWNRPNSSDQTVALATAAVSAAAGGEPGVTEADREQLGSLLVGFYTYLKTNAPSFPELAPAVQEMHSAVAAYHSGQSQDPFGPIKKVHASIAAQRRNNPSIPKP